MLQVYIQLLLTSMKMEEKIALENSIWICWLLFTHMNTTNRGKLKSWENADSPFSYPNNELHISVLAI